MMFSIMTFSELSAATLPVRRLIANAFLSVVPAIRSPESVRYTESSAAPVDFEISVSSITQPSSSVLTITALELLITKQKMPSLARAIGVVSSLSRLDLPMSSKMIPLEEE